MNIEKLEALERAKDDPTCSADEFCERCTKLAYAQQAAFPALLAVAKAARVLSKWTEAEIDGTIKLRDDTYANNALADLCESLAQLEATP